MSLWSEYQPKKKIKQKLRNNAILAEKQSISPPPPRLSWYPKGIVNSTPRKCNYEQSQLVPLSLSN